MKRFLVPSCLIAVIVIGAMVIPASGAEGKPDWFAFTDDTAKPASHAPTESSPPKPIPWLTVGFEYVVVSDYIWRGLNLSEYAGEGREKLNHQTTVSFEIDIAELGCPIGGSFGGSIWFEWYAAQEKLTPHSGRNLQEVDFSLHYSHDIGDTGLTGEFGWIAYTFPPMRDSGAGQNRDGSYTHEVYLLLSYDDSNIFGKPMLNPTVAYYLDVDDVRASFIALGISHDFKIGNIGCPISHCPILKDLTVTPSATLAIDHRYYDKTGFGSANSIGTRLGYIEYGLEMSLDLSSALNISTTYGSLTLGTFINFVQSIHDENTAVQDEFYGGMKIGWEW